MGHPGVVIRKFSEELSKTLPVELFSILPGYGHKTVQPNHFELFSMLLLYSPVGWT